MIEHRASRSSSSAIGVVLLSIASIAADAFADSPGTSSELMERLRSGSVNQMGSEPIVDLAVTTWYRDEEGRRVDAGRVIYQSSGAREFLQWDIGVEDRIEFPFARKVLVAVEGEYAFELAYQTPGGRPQLRRVGRDPVKIAEVQAELGAVANPAFPFWRVFGKRVDRSFDDSLYYQVADFAREPVSDRQDRISVRLVTNSRIDERLAAEALRHHPGKRNLIEDREPIAFRKATVELDLIGPPWMITRRELAWSYDDPSLDSVDIIRTNGRMINERFVPTEFEYQIDRGDQSFSGGGNVEKFERSPPEPAVFKPETYGLPAEYFEPPDRPWNWWLLAALFLTAVIGGVAASRLR